MLYGEALVAAQHGDYAEALRKQTALYMGGLLNNPQLLALQEPKRIFAVSNLIPDLERLWREAVEEEFAACAERIFSELQLSLRNIDKLAHVRPSGIEVRANNTAPMLVMCPWCDEEHAILKRVTPEEFQTILFRRTIVKFGFTPCAHTLPIFDSHWRIIQNQQHILNTPVT